MIPVSIVIITKNEAEIIAKCIVKARLITDDIIIVDSGSTDETLEIAHSFGCRIFKTFWDGYGANKNKGIDVAKYDWILSIDADEVPDEELIKSLHTLTLDNVDVIYDIKFRSYFGKRAIRFGSWGRDHHVRLFNRTTVKWSETSVHENLLQTERTRTRKIKGYLHHYSVKNIAEYDTKGCYYAKLSAKQYFRNGIKASAIKLYISPLFGFFKNYVLYFGFLDGREGWDIAMITIRNTRRKYYFLGQMENQANKKRLVEDKLIIEY